jgi:hypothetical protein
MQAHVQLISIHPESCNWDQDARLEVLITMKVQATVFWIVTMCNEMAYFIDDFSQENYIAVNPYNATC